MLAHPYLFSGGKASFYGERTELELIRFEGEAELKEVFFVLEKMVKVSCCF
jgi:hypothetical protein